MKKLVIAILFILALIPVSAQEYKVVSFETATGDLTARVNRRVDANGRKCALLKVYVSDGIDHAGGSSVGEIVSKGMEKWIYMAHDSKQVELVFDNHLPLRIVFDNYNVPVLTEQTVYVVKLVEEGAGTPQPAAVAASAPSSSGSVSDILQEAKNAYDEGYYDKALTLFHKISDDKEAAYMIGEIYRYGKGVPQNENEAFQWIKKAAELGFAVAQNKLGDMLYIGSGAPKDYVEATKWYRKAAEQGDAVAQNNLGDMYYIGQGIKEDYAEAYRWYRKAAEQGFAPAQINLGYMYYRGENVSQDYAEAIRWYRKAADQGVANAQNQLGFFYYKGLGVTKDYDEAIRWFRKGADQGHAPAQYNLGNMYFNGENVSKDYTEAFHLYQKAAEQGLGNAKFHLYVMYYNGEILGISTNYAITKYWYDNYASNMSSHEPILLEDNYSKLSLRLC